MVWQIYRRLTPLRVLSFDLDDTLYANAPVMAKAEQEVMGFLVARCPALACVSIQQWRTLRQQIAMTNKALASDMTALRLTSLQQELKRRQVPQAEKLAAEAMEVFFIARNQVNIAPEVHELLAQLAEKYTLIALSNGNADVARMGLADYFTVALRPELGVRGKPFTDLFAKAAELIHLSQPQQMLHIGDHPISDVQGALRFGAQAVWYNSPYKPMEGIPQLTTLPHASIGNLQALKALI